MKTYILVSANSMLGDRLNQDADFKTYKILEGVGLLLTGTKFGGVILPFSQIRGIYQIEEDAKKTKK